MNIKIYHNNKTILLTNEDKSWHNNIESKIVYVTTNLSLIDYWDIITTNEDLYIFFYNEDIIALKEAFFKNFMLITAGGGVVENEKGEVLLMYRRGFWDLPKGKWDDGETIEECALREIEEETGLTNLLLENLLTISYHTYFFKEKWILKETYWFNIKTNSNQLLNPQKEEDIEEIKWVKKDILKNFYNVTYQNIVDVLLKKY